VNPGQRIDLLEAAAEIKVYEMKIPVVYEDDHLAILNKPGGIPTSGNQFRNLENTLPYNLKPSPEPDAYRLPRAVHRLDSATCGLVVVAKTARARMELGRQFEERKVEKKYQAVVIGEIAAEGEFRSEIDGKQAFTRFRRVQVSPSLRFGHLSLVDLFPETGRTHQLRIHLSGTGFPVLGDKLYGEEGLIFRGKGLFLCSVQLDFFHPVSKEKLVLKISPPAKFHKMLERENQRYK
jgi:23S rRNA pseudouridine1911/1915/1917 synthase